MTGRRHSIFIALLTLAFISKGLLWTVASPPWQTPDEPAHAGYAERIYVDRDPFLGRVRMSEAMRVAAEVGLLNEVSHHPQYPGALTPGELRDRRAAIESIPDAARDDQTGFYLSAAGYPPLYYVLGAATFAMVEAAGGSYLTQLQALRMLSVGIAALAFLLQVAVLRELFGRGFRAVAGAGIIAFMPMYGYVSASFNPDVLMTAWMSAALLVTLRAVRSRPSLRSFLLLASIIAAGMLTKPTAIALFVLIPVLGVAAARRPDGWRGAHAAAVTIGASIAAVVPHAVFTVLDSSPSAAEALARDSGSALEWDALVAYANVFRDAFMMLYHSSFWGNYGWLDAGFNPWLYEFLLVVALIAAAGLLLRLARRPGWSAAWIALLLPTAALCAMLVGIEFATVSEAGGPAGLFIQGRYLFPLMVVLVALYVHGVTALDRWSWTGRAALAGSVVLMLGFQCATWVILLLPRYSL